MIGGRTVKFLLLLDCYHCFEKAVEAEPDWVAPAKRSAKLDTWRVPCAKQSLKKFALVILRPRGLFWLRLEFFHRCLSILFFSLFQKNNTQFVQNSQRVFQKRPKLFDIFLNSNYILRCDAKLLHLMANFGHLGLLQALLSFQLDKFFPFL